MMRFYRKIENFWFENVSEKVRFLLVGGFNTCLSYVIFLLFEWQLGYKIAVAATYVIAINVSIFTMRYYVFRAKGKILNQYLKAGGVYVITIAANYLFLFLMIDLAKSDAWFAQALFTLISTNILV